MTRKQIEAKAKRLCQKFCDDAQALFDDDAMTDELASGEVFDALMAAQGYAEEVTLADV